MGIAQINKSETDEFYDSFVWPTWLNLSIAKKNRLTPVFSCCCLFCCYVFSPILYLVSLGEPMSPFGYYSITIFSGRPSWNFGFTEPTCFRFPSILYSTQHFLLLSFVQLSGLPMKGQDACEHILFCLYHHCVSSTVGFQALWGHSLSV